MDGCGCDQTKNNQLFLLVGSGLPSVTEGRVSSQVVSVKEMEASVSKYYRLRLSNQEFSTSQHSITLLR